MANGNSKNSGSDPTTAKTPEAPPPEAPKVTVATPEPPSTGMRPVLATGGLLAVGGGAIYLIHRWRRSQVLADIQGPPLPQSSGPMPAPSPTPTPTPGPNPAPPGFWGTSLRGQEYRELLAKIEAVTRMPLRLFLSVVANRESGWSRKARRKDKVETAASRRAIEAGPARGNPPPKFAASLAEAGSGGLFGALAPYVAWTGLDEGLTPYLDEDYTIVEDPIVAAICAAKYYQRIVANYPTVFATPGAPVPEDNYRVRLGWASPKVLSEDPGGTLFTNVKRRMDEDLKALGLSIGDLLPPSATGWPGLAAVVEGMKTVPVTWK